MNYWGIFNESWGGASQHRHFNPYIFAGLPATQVDIHYGAQTIGGFSTTDPWLNTSAGMPNFLYQINGL